MCEHCCDTGVMSVEMRVGKVLMLIRCNCDEGTKQPYELPQWSGAMREILTVRPFPAEWFVAKKDADVKAKTDQWLARIKVAEEFWKHQE